jgi:hypothetical protein
MEGVAERNCFVKAGARRAKRPQSAMLGAESYEALLAPRR